MNFADFNKKKKTNYCRNYFLYIYLKDRKKKKKKKKEYGELYKQFSNFDTIITAEQKNIIEYFWGPFE